ncbi:MAG: universal stress protein [Proteobacteria bacterium]|nr:universal stress protein [Pseudomonadota bacterium]
MHEYKRILLASHGTKGAMAAESHAISLCNKGGSIDHLEIVPDFWKDMMGDDWLNNASTQQVYGQYVESQLEQEIQQRMDVLKEKIVTAGINYTPYIKLGKLADCLIEQDAANNYDVIVIGSPRPKGEEGYRSRMQLEPLVKSLTTPLLIIPFPG